MTEEYIGIVKGKLLKHAERSLLLAKAKLENRLVVMVDQLGKTEMTYQRDSLGDDTRKCIKLNSGDETNAIQYTAPISQILDLIKTGDATSAASRLESVFRDIKTALPENSTSVQFLKMAKKNLDVMCQLDENADDIDMNKQDDFLLQKVIE